jgi:hypothetical protein
MDDGYQMMAIPHLALPFGPGELKNDEKKGNNS